MTGALSSGTCRALMNYCEWSGIDSRQIMRTAGVSSQTITDPDGVLSYEQVCTLWAHAYAAAGDDNLALHAAEWVAASGARSMMYFLCASSPSVGAAYEKLTTHLSCIDNMTFLRTDREPARIGLVQGKRGGFQAARQEIEWFFGLCYLVPRAATGSAYRPASVEFASPGPEDASEHVRIFGCPVSFGQPANRIWFDAEVWELPSNHANAELLRIVEAHAARVTMPPFDSTADAVRRLVRAQLEAGPLELERVARQLAMSTRTLQRRLSAEGASFARIVENTRDECARELLRARELSIAEIALLLGFSEQSAFTRAFKGWTGTTPAQFRRGVG